MRLTRVAEKLALLGDELYGSGAVVYYSEFDGV